MRQLRPCPRCGRHVRIGEPSCPFCSAALDTGGARLAPVRPQRRIARLAFMAATATACSTSAAIPGDAYGLPADAAPVDGGPDMGLIASDAYGAPSDVFVEPDTGSFPSDAYGISPDVADADEPDR